MNFQGAIFDLDGTVLDSMGVWRQIDVDFLGKRGYDVPDDYLKNITALGFKEAAAYTKKRFSLPESPEMLIDEWFQMAEDAYAHTVFCKPYVKEYLKLLKSKGIKLAVATSSDEALYIPALKHNGIYDLFDACVMSKEVARKKGYPDIYLEAACRVGLNAEKCIVYEDILAGIKGAKAGGFTAVGVYDEHSEYEHEEMKQMADYFICSWEEEIKRIKQGQRIFE